MRGSWIAVAVAVAACSPDGTDPALIPNAHAAQAAKPPTTATAATAPLAAPWTFAVISDLHLPNFRAPKVHATIAALVALHVRFVVVAGDSTNGTTRGWTSRAWWKTVTAALQPLRDAGIGVLPLAGNHDSYHAWQREAYASAFADLDGWASPLAITSRGDKGIAGAPFTYSVDVDGVHLALVHLVSQSLDRDVGAWLARDLATAAGARHRIVFAHVPLVSVIRRPSATLLAKLGAILEHGKVDHYVAGHEHIVWDETVTLPAAGSLRQVIVGCASGFYGYAPSVASKERAGCIPTELAGQREPMRCKMPNGGAFTLSRGRKNRHLQHATNSFTLFTVDGDSIRVKPMTVDAAAQPQPFYLDE